MTIKELETAIDNAEADIRHNIDFYGQLMRIGFTTEAQKVKLRLKEQHEKVVKMKELYKRSMPAARC